MLRCAQHSPTPLPSNDDCAVERRLPPRRLPEYSALAKLIESQAKQQRRLDWPYVFHRAGVEFATSAMRGARRRNVLADPA
jgi:hypothetical protein